MTESGFHIPNNPIPIISTSMVGGSVLMWLLCEVSSKQCYISVDRLWLRVKNGSGTGKWKHGLKPAVFWSKVNDTYPYGNLQVETSTRATGVSQKGHTNRRICVLVKPGAWDGANWDGSVGVIPSFPVETNVDP